MGYILDLRKLVGHRPLIQVGAGIIVEDPQGRVLLQLRSDNHCWGYCGGSIELDQRVEEAAKRELFEESGIRDADVYPVCDYWGFNPFRCSNGMVFLAVVHSIGELPESEMQEIGVFDELPENLTYPQTSPVLYREAEKLLMLRTDLKK